MPEIPDEFSNATAKAAAVDYAKAVADAQREHAEALAKLRAAHAKKLATIIKGTVKQLTAAMGEAMRESQLDEAIKIREAIRALKVQTAD